MTRTIKEWFECFPAEYRIRVVRMAKKDGNSEILNCQVKTAEEALIVGIGMKSIIMNGFRDILNLIPQWEKEGRFDRKTVNIVLMEEPETRTFTEEDMMGFAEWASESKWSWNSLIKIWSTIKISPKRISYPKKKTTSELLTEYLKQKEK